MPKPEGIKVITRNRKARHDYEILETIEAGLVLLGSEIKSIRAGRVSLVDGYAQPRDEEMWLLNVHISPYEQASMYGHEPRRPRKLLLRKREIRNLSRELMEKGLTLVPLQVYLRRGLAKVELGLVRGKKKYDKRQALRARDDKRRVERALRDY